MEKNDGFLCNVIMEIYNLYNNKRLNSLESLVSFKIIDGFKVVSQAQDIFESEPSILDIKSKPGDKNIIIVGDLHGSLESLLRIFQSNGFPPKNRYLFLGDLIDRGKNSCEVIVLLYALKCLYKDDIFIIRGNHEFRDMAEHYGFREECIKRIKTSDYHNKYLDGEEFFDQVTNTFKYLPIGAIVNDRKLCVHGGISALIKNRKELLGLKKVGDNYTSHDSAQAEILWNDPDDSILTYQRSPRGLGCIFGQQALNDFLENMEIDLVIRGHQNEHNGYNWVFGKNGGILTVFSAIDYCGATNDGGIAVLHNDEHESIEIKTYNTQFKKLTIPTPLGILEKNTLLMEFDLFQQNILLDIPRLVDF